MADKITLPEGMIGDRLNEETIDSFVPSEVGQADSELEIDLSEIVFATPYAIILLSLIIKACHQKGYLIQVKLPTCRDVLNYLQRMNFFDEVADCNINYNEDIEELRTNKRNPSSSVIEITRIEKEEDVSRIVNDLAEKLIGSHGCDQQAINKFSEVMIETFQNATQHSNPKTGVADAIAAVQVYKNEFHFVIADSGIGIAESLKINPRFSSMNLSDIQAIEGVLKHGYSRIDTPGRGGGLERVQEITKNMSGEVLVRSNSGLVRFTEQAMEKAVVNRLNGTQICIKCQTSLFKAHAA